MPNGQSADTDETPRSDAGIGASDGTSGGGAGAGIPDGDTLLRNGDPAPNADVAKDRAKLFPDATTHRGGQSSDVSASDQPAPTGT